MTTEACLTLVYLVTEDWFFRSHFLERAVAARAAGYDVLVLANLTGHQAVLQAASLRCLQVPISRRGLNPFAALRTLFCVWRIYRRERPAMVHHIALKPILIGTLAARLSGVRSVVNAPVGMGFVFTSQSLLARGLRPLVWTALRLLLNPPGSRVVYENPDDLAEAVKHGFVRKDACDLIRGAGVDLSKFSPRPEPDGKVVITMVARLLWDKGVGEFVEAARICRRRGLNVRFRLVGGLDSGNPASVSEFDLAEWRREGCVECLGQRDDISEILAASHIVCLPSYREGLPKSLLEGLAAGRPLIATDVPGCRETIRQGENGFLVPPRDAVALADAVACLAQDANLRHRMGEVSRQRAEQEFGSGIVIRQTLDVYRRQLPVKDAISGESTPEGHRLLIVVNDPAFFVSHRLPIAVEAKARGFDVHVATKEGNAVAQITAAGLTHHVLPFSRSGVNPFMELRVLFATVGLFRRLKPRLVHLVTIKPVIYGGIAARLAAVPAVVAAISGLGFVFVGTGFKARLIRAIVAPLFRGALGGRNLRAIFQNPDDRKVFLKMRAVRSNETRLIRGSGVDLDVYRVVPEPEAVPVVTMVSRLLADKGVREFVQAAEMLRGRGVAARFLIVGDADFGNPSSVAQEEIESWRDSGVVEMLGQRRDVPEILAGANIVVLPSYREGLPKVLLEAAACGRAVVTTDVPGCRDAIEPGETGVLVPVRKVAPLADAIAELLEDGMKRRMLGASGRALAEREFDIRRVVAAHLEIYEELLRPDARLGVAMSHES